MTCEYMSPGYCRKVSWQILFMGHRSEDVWPISDLYDGYLRLYSMPAALSVLSQLPLSRSTGCCCFRYFRISVRENSPPPSPLPNPMKGRGGERRGGGARGPPSARASARLANSFIHFHLAFAFAERTFVLGRILCMLAGKIACI